MNGLVVIYVKEPPEPVKVEVTPEGTKLTREVQKTDTLTGRKQFATIGALVPYVYLDGKPLGILRNLEVVSNAEFMRPSVRMERILFSHDDAILTMTPEEHARWRIERQFEDLMDFVRRLPPELQIVTVKEKEASLAEVSCLGNSLCTGKGLILELIEKHRTVLPEARFEGDLS